MHISNICAPFVMWITELILPRVVFIAIPAFSPRRCPILLWLLALTSAPPLSSDALAHTPACLPHIQTCLEGLEMVSSAGHMRQNQWGRIVCTPGDRLIRQMELKRPVAEGRPLGASASTGGRRRGCGRGWPSGWLSGRLRLWPRKSCDNFGES